MNIRRVSGRESMFIRLTNVRGPVETKERKPNLRILPRKLRPQKAHRWFT